MTKLEALKIRHQIQRTMLWIRQAIELATLQGANEMISAREAALIAEFNTATNEVAEEVARLVAAAGLSPEAEAEFKKVITRLHGLGANPEQPIPPTA